MKECVPTKYMRYQNEFVDPTCITCAGVFFFASQVLLRTQQSQIHGTHCSILLQTRRVFLLRLHPLSQGNLLILFNQNSRYLP